MHRLTVYATLRVGNFFFKIRSFTPIPFILALLYFAEPVWYTVGVGVLFIAVGEFLRIWAVGYAGASTRARTLGAARDLVTTGPYSYVRNPLYLGNFLLSLGVCFVANVYWLVAVLVVGYFFQYLTDYCRWRKLICWSPVVQSIRHIESSVPRFVPRFRPYPEPSSARFLFRTRHQKRKTDLDSDCLRHRIDFRETNR